MYDPTIGRWITQDPLGIAAGDGNLYRYVGDSPSNLIDPEGLYWEDRPEQPNLVAESVRANSSNMWRVVRIGTPSGTWVAGTFYSFDNISRDNSGFYQATMDLFFFYRKDACGTERFRFMQAVKDVDLSNGQSRFTGRMQDRTTDSGWAIDRRDVSFNSNVPDLDPWYGYDNQDNLRPQSQRIDEFVKRYLPQGSSVHTWDQPQWHTPDGRYRNHDVSFETAVFGEKDDGAFKFIGALTWGFKVNANGTMTPHVVEAHQAPSADFVNAAVRWDEQAQKTPGQLQIGPLDD